MATAATVTQRRSNDRSVPLGQISTFYDCHFTLNKYSSVSDSTFTSSLNLLLMFRGFLCFEIKFYQVMEVLIDLN